MLTIPTPVVGTGTICIHDAPCIQPDPDLVGLVLAAFHLCQEKVVALLNFENCPSP
jgi:hypothetical protein